MNSNLALITTLYNTPGADLYKDIYFPLIRYSVMSIYLDYERDKQKHYDVEALQEKINEKSGILIPLQVLKTSICMFASRGAESGIQIYEKGNFFRITEDITKGLDDVEINVDKVSENYRKLEIFFQEYLEIEGLTSSKTVKDFFQNSSLEVLEYIDNTAAQSVINQEYVNVIRFIDWIKIAKPDYYLVVENMLWGAIVAGFLQRSNVDLGIKTVDKVDYYLDSSLVLSLLGLNSSENVSYARDLARIISESGAVIKVHSITIREIRRILEQVEISQAPRRGSSIEHAWVEQGMTLSDILHIRNSLSNLLKKNNVTITCVSDSELDGIEQKYKNNFDVKLLAEERGAKNEDLIREIHDIYMRDYVQSLNKEGTVIEKQCAYFVSLNTDLVKFSHRGEARSISVIHAAKVVMNLWLHSVNNSIIKRTALAEVMSRCYALNQTDVRIRLKVFYKYYRDCSLTQEDIMGMYSSLIHRSASTIAAVDAIMENEENGPDNKTEISKEIINGLKEAIAKEKAEREVRSEATQNRISELTARTAALEKAIDEGKKETSEKDSIIAEYKKDKSLNEASIERLKEELQTERELREIEAELYQLNNRKVSLIKQREDSVSYFKYWLIIIAESIACLFMVSCLVMAFVMWDKDKLFNIFTIGFAASLLVCITRVSNMYLLSPKVIKMRLRDEQYKYWEDQHPEYSKLMTSIQALEQRKHQLKGI